MEMSSELRQGPQSFALRDPVPQRIKGSKEEEGVGHNGNRRTILWMRGRRRRLGKEGEHMKHDEDGGGGRRGMRMREDEEEEEEAPGNP